MSEQLSRLPENAVWFVTGCSSGVGASICKYVVQQGHRVVATARKPQTLDYLENSPKVLKIALDVTSKDSIDTALKEALEKFGRIDVLVNNAGYGMMAVVEGADDKEMRALIETDFWGPVNLTKEAIRIFREVNPDSGVKGGVVVQVSSMGGRVTFLAPQSITQRDKFALEGFTESVSKEMHPDWNIQFLIVEPGGTKTAFAHESMVYSQVHPAYADPSLPLNQLLQYMKDPKIAASWTDPMAVAKIVFDVVGKEDMPLRIPTGADAWGMIRAWDDEKAKEMDKWKSVSESTEALLNFRNGAREGERLELVRAEVVFQN